MVQGHYNNGIASKDE
ncbi:hypothetical protein M3182_08620 [Mesobacillus maritimus]|nr:hypothetical protein [Mesobacillus maritimus]MCM3670566.1 hypothetical protein [Mesobacillus maritimus]